MRPDHGEHRQKDSNDEKDRCGPIEKGLQAQPEIKTDTAVGPGHRQRNKLDRDVIGRRDPVGEQCRRVVEWRQAEQRAGKPFGPEVAGKPEGNAQAKKELRELGDRVAEMASLVEGPQTKREMDDRGKVERVVDDWISPPPDVDIAATSPSHRRKYCRAHD